MIVHTINNAMSIFANYYYGSHVLTENTAEDYFVPGDWLWVSIGSGVLSILLMIYLSRIYFKNRVERGDI